VPLACVAACAALAVGYSHRAVGWKAHRFGGPAGNVLGYGLLSPLAGFGVVGVSLHLRPVLVLIGVMFGVLGAYFAAQVFQEREDRARGYGTLVARCGAQAAVRATRWSLGAASGTLALLAVVGFLPRVVLLGLPGSLWVDRWCVQWAALPGGGGVAAALELSRRLGWSVALDLALLFAAYAADSFSGGPVAGLATARGLPG
jgi:4-hydroxybenzoate polyprenyltransferase